MGIFQGLKTVGSAHSVGENTPPPVEPRRDMSLSITKWPSLRYPFSLILAIAVLSCPLVFGQDLEESSDAKVLWATRATAPIELDGVLDEADWERSEPAVGFVQQNPREGQPETERRKFRVL